MKTTVTLKSKDENELIIYLDGDLTRKQIKQKTKLKIDALGYDHFGYIIIDIRKEKK